MRADRQMNLLTLPVIKEVDESKCVLLKKQWFIKDNGEAVHSKYHIQPNHIGQGGFGRVYKARMKDNENIVRAIKKIDIRKELNRTQLYRFIKQIEILKTLDHPNLVKLYQTYQTKDYIYLVMEFCGGGQLFDRVRQKRRLSQFEAKNIFRDMARIVKYLHSQDVCHRDLKLENFIFSGDSPGKPGMLKLIDFGLSAVVEQNTDKKLRSFVGTPEYLSPQVLKNEYQIKCDVWSMGIILIMMITGEMPFASTKDQQILASIADKKIRKPKNISFLLKDLLQKIFTDQKSRISASQILQHPWLIDTRKKNSASQKINLHRLKKFSNYSPLKKVILSIIASQVNPQDIERYARLFIVLDVKSNGFLSLQELLQGVRQEQLDKYSLKQLEQIIQGLDTDKNGKISYTQFLAAIMPKRIYITQQNVKLAFDLIDKDGNGTIEFDELKQLIRVDSGVDSIKEKQWLKIIKEVDTKQDGILSYDQFQYLLRN